MRAWDMPVLCHIQYVHTVPYCKINHNHGPRHACLPALMRMRKDSCTPLNASCDHVDRACCCLAAAAAAAPAAPHLGLLLALAGDRRERKVTHTKSTPLIQSTRWRGGIRLYVIRCTAGQNFHPVVRSVGHSFSCTSSLHSCTSLPSASPTRP